MSPQTDYRISIIHSPAADSGGNSLIPQTQAAIDSIVHDDVLFILVRTGIAFATTSYNVTYDYFLPSSLSLPELVNQGLLCFSSAPSTSPTTVPSEAPSSSVPTGSSSLFCVL
jgi:hypothetical protein